MASSFHGADVQTGYTAVPVEKGADAEGPIDVAGTM
jgi:hypothetical protein